MSRFKVMLALGVVLLLSVLPMVSLAADTYVCQVATFAFDGGTTASVDGGVGGRTDYPVFGSSCNWGAGAVLGVQCTADTHYRARGANVLLSPGAPTLLADGGMSTPGNIPQATTKDVKMTFTNNTDPFIIALKPDERILSFVGASASGTCNIYSHYVK